MNLFVLKYLKYIYLPMIVLASFSACSFWQSADNSNSLKDSEIIAEVSNNIPFSTKEPKNFQAEIVVASIINSNKTEQKYFIAKSGKESLQKFSVGKNDERWVLRTGENKLYFVNHQTKNYREISNETSGAFSDDSLIKNLTSKWLNEKAATNFENLGTEKNLTKYRVKFAAAKNSEILIFVDENIKIPVRQEFYSVAGEDKKILTYSIEIKNFKPNAEAELFELPKNYKQIESK